MNKNNKIQLPNNKLIQKMFGKLNIIKPLNSDIKEPKMTLKEIVEKYKELHQNGK